MNPIIKSRLPQEYQMLWNLTKKQKIAGDLAAMTQNQIRHVRKNFRSTKRDPLVEKFLNFGNEGLWSAEKIRELAALIYDDKKPDAVNLGEWISVEIECVIPNEEAETNFIKFVRRNGLVKFITIKNDGSLRVISPHRLNRDEERRIREETGTVNFARLGRNAGAQLPRNLQQEQADTRLAYGREIIMTFRYGDWKFVSAVCGELNRLKCYVNSSCGMHVHFDCRNLQMEDVLRVGKRLAYAIPALKQLLPPSRQENRFCQRDINAFEGRNEDRYSFINLQAFSRHRTIEIRAHGGTTDPVKIVNWIRILRKIMTKRQRKPINTASELISAFKMDKDLVDYINGRFTRFTKGVPVTPEQAHLDDIELDNLTFIPESEEIAKAEPIELGKTRPISEGAVEYRRMNNEELVAITQEMLHAFDRRRAGRGLPENLDQLFRHLGVEQDGNNDDEGL
jgi:hypothetical protein